MKKTWWKQAVIYQIYPRSFQDSNGDGIGDLRGIQSRLDYLKELGVDAIWLCPIYPSPNYDNGYDISDYCGINPEFGTMEDFAALLAAMHQRGIRLIMDFVLNHTSIEHPWFQQAIRNPDSPYRDYYFFRDGKNGGPPNNWSSHFSFSAWTKEPYGEQYYLHLYCVEQPDLNWDHPAVRQEAYRIIDFWKQKGVDGFRMDVVNYFSKVPDLPDMPGEGLQLPIPYIANGPHIHEYLHEMNQQEFAGTDLMTVGEMVFVDTETARLYTAESREELNMVFTFEHMYLDSEGVNKWKCRPWKLAELKECFTRWQMDLAGECWNSLYLNNHDQPRMVSRFGSDGVWREKSAKMLATFLHTLQGTPFVYQGEELGMTNVPFSSLQQFRDVDTLNHYEEAVHIDQRNPESVMAEILKKSRDHARTPMQWNRSKNAGFTDARPWIDVNPNYLQINAEDERAQTDSVWSYYRQLIALRRQHPVMAYGDYRLLCKEHPKAYVYERSFEDVRWLVVLNFSAENCEVILPEEIRASNEKPVIFNRKDICFAPILQLEPYDAAVWEIES